LNAYLGDALHECLHHIVGVQFRNVATVGGSVFGRFGYSDVLTLFLALDCRVRFFHAGEMPLADFAAREPLEKELRNDILEAVILPKGVRALAYRSVRNSGTDFPVLTCCVARTESWRVSVGARPMRAALVVDADGLLDGDMSPAKFGEWAAGQYTTGSNVRASAAYRKKMIAVLVRRNVQEILDKQTREGA
jgi:CO/xanthine dehydrogenase FAD-binding subunit